MNQQINDDVLCIFLKRLLKLRFVVTLIGKFVRICKKGCEIGKRGKIAIPLAGLIPPLFCAYPKQGFVMDISLCSVL